MISFKPGFQSFVAWRYLLARPHRVSRLALWIVGVCAVVLIGALVVMRVYAPEPRPRSLLPREVPMWLLYMQGVAGAAGGIGFLALFFGVLRYLFTFFTTVPIGGVWVGTWALVIVLSVMSGFESDLRVKILGSNAHMQVTKPAGGFTEWEKVKTAIDAVPGVVASMPFATTETVIAANSNYATAVVKGVDPTILARVTRLGADLEDPDALRRMAPLVHDELPTEIAPAPTGGPGTDVVDPAPGDMPVGGDPIDFSDEAASTGTGAPRDWPSGERPATGSGADIEPPPSFGGDARAALDPAPDDFDQPVDPEPLAAGDEPGAGDAADADTDERGADDGETRVIRLGPDGATANSELGMSRRTASLPGILVGRELAKQIHLYTGQEVRLVSPLSDPANPDATGTPIPYNRDYRVAGVFFTGMYEYDLKSVYVPLESLQDFLDLGDSIDGLEIRISDPEATEQVATLLSAALGPDYLVTDWKELNRSLFSALKLEKIAMFLVLAIIILVASFSIVGNLIMIVIEKSKEIALLKTLGASDSGIMMLFVTQGFFIGLIGTSLGVAVGLLGCWLLQTFGFPLNPDVYYIDQLPVHVDPTAVALIGTAGVLISVAATVYPALVAARLRPATGLRHD
jgi:lipoprotein-releasing system permease protein